MKKIESRGLVVMIFVLIIIVSVGIQCDNQVPKNLRVYKATVNYNLSPDEMLIASNYQWCAGDLKKDQLTGKGVQEIELFVVPIEKEFLSGEVVQYLNSLGLKSANFAQLLALAAIDPDIEKDGAIVAMGSQWWDYDKDRVCPVLRNDNGKRGIAIQRMRYLNLLDVTWDTQYRFLAYK